MFLKKEGGGGELGLDESAQTEMDIKVGSKWKLLVCCCFKVPPAEHAKIQDPTRLQRKVQYFKKYSQGFSNKIACSFPRKKLAFLCLAPVKTPCIGRAPWQNKMRPYGLIWGILLQTSTTQEMKHSYSYSIPKEDI